jgi:hypothetical protein
VGFRGGERLREPLVKLGGHVGADARHNKGHLVAGHQRMGR